MRESENSLSQGEPMVSIRHIIDYWSLLFIFSGAFFARVVTLAGSLLMEEPYGFFGTVNPTGHNAIYFERICAETPVKLRRCRAGEMGAVISRYEGIDGYDWVAIPLIPYLYSVENRIRRSGACRSRDW